PGEIRLAKCGSPAGLQDPQGPAVLDLLLLSRSPIQQRHGLHRGVWRLKVHQQLAELRVELAALVRVVGLEAVDEPAHRRVPGTAESAKHNLVDAQQVELLRRIKPIPEDSVQSFEDPLTESEIGLELILLAMGRIASADLRQCQKRIQRGLWALQK